MKKLNFLMRAALPLFLPSLAWASQVEVYGVIDTGIAVARVNGETRVYEETGFMRPSRFGFKGKEDLGNGRAVSFVLEQGFDSNNGAQSQGANYAFGREANLTYECAYGKFGMGRIGNFMSGMGSWDPWGPNSGPFATGWGIAASGSSMSDYLRMDNTFAWQSPKIDGWQVMAQYSLDVLGTEAERNVDNTRYLSGGVTYMKNGLNVLAFAGWRMNPTVEGKGYKDGQTYGLALNKQFDGFKPYLAAQYARNSLSVGKKPLSVFKAVEAKHPNTKGINGIAIITGTDISCFSGTFKTAVQYFHGKNEGAENKDKLKRLIFSIGQEYPLSKRTVLYAGTNWGKSEAKAHGHKEITRALELFSGIKHSF